MSVISMNEAARDRRFNAVKQNFTGAHIIIDDSQRERYLAALDRFTQLYKPEADPVREFLVAELAKSTWQIERLEAVIARTAAEKGDLCDDLRLLHRYLNDHRRNFYRATRELMEIRRQTLQEDRFAYKVESEAPLARFCAQTRRIEVAGRASETKLLQDDPYGFNNLLHMEFPAAAAASQ